MNNPIDSLNSVARLWLDTENPFRAETVQALRVSTGLSPHQIEMALTNCFGEVTGEKILAYLQSRKKSAESLRPSSSAKKILHVLPANAFTAWIHGVVLSLLSGRSCDLKVSSRELVFPRAWQASLAQMDKDLADQVRLCEWGEEPWERYDMVVAYGSDETLRKIQSQLPSGLPFVGYGHKVSVAVVFKDSDAAREKVIQDSEPFDLQGCLSPQILYVDHALHGLFDDLSNDLPVSPKVQTFQDWEHLSHVLEQYVPYLSCIGVAGSIEDVAHVRQASAKWGVSRVCSLGQMQRPPLGWPNGGVDLMDLLN